MKLSKVTIENFRSYSHRVEFSIEQITAIIGKNDIGKSSILDALDTFFNQNKLDIADRNIHSADSPVIIGCAFSDLPDEIVLDDSVSTTLEAEYVFSFAFLICETYSTLSDGHPSFRECPSFLFTAPQDLRGFFPQNSCPGSFNFSLGGKLQSNSSAAASST